MRIAAVLVLLLAASSTCRKEAGPPIRPDLTDVDVNPTTGLPFFKGADMNPVWKLRSREGLRRLGRFRLVASNGRAVTEDIARNRFVVVSFFYSTCRGICPSLLQNLKGLLPQVERASDILMLSFSIDPQSDGPAQIEAFLRRQRVHSPHWLFLTGNRGDLFRLARDTFNADTLVQEGQGVTDFVHSENVFLLDRSGYVRAVYRGRGPAAIPLIVQDIRSLRAEPPVSLSSR